MGYRPICSYKSGTGLFKVEVGLCQDGPLSLILFIIYMERIYRHSQKRERVGGLRNPDAGDDLQRSLEQFAAVW